MTPAPPPRPRAIQLLLDWNLSFPDRINGIENISTEIIMFQLLGDSLFGERRYTYSYDEVSFFTNYFIVISLFEK